MSIDWAFWGEVGMADRAFEQEMSSITALGYTVISPDRGIQLFERLACRACDTDWCDSDQLGEIPRYMWQTPTRFLEAFASLSPSDVHDDIDQRASFRQELEQLPADERGDLLRDHLRAAISKVLGLRSVG